MRTQGLGHIINDCKSGQGQWPSPAKLLLYEYYCSSWAFAAITNGA